MRFQLGPDSEAVLIVLGIGAFVLGTLTLIKKRFADKAKSWPTITARVENVFVDASSRGPNRPEETHAVLAYSYSIRDSYCSGQIRLLAGEGSLEVLDKEMIAQEVLVHYNPDQPEVSIFMGEEVRGWDVLQDRRISLLSWLSR